MDYAKRIAVLEEKRAAADADILLLQSMARPDVRKIADLKKWKLKWKDEIAELKNPVRMTSPKSGKPKKRKATKAECDLPSIAPASTSLDDSGDEVSLAA